MTYVIETRADNTTSKRLLKRTEMRTVRATAGYTLFDHKRNEEIRVIGEVQDILTSARGQEKNEQTI